LAADPLDPYGVDLEALARKQRLAQLLMQQGQDTSPVYAPMQGIARVAAAIMGNMGAKEADDSARALATRRQTDRASEVAAVMEAAQGGDKNKLARLLAGSTDPVFQQMGLAAALKDKEEEYGTEPRPMVGPDGKPTMSLISKRGTVKGLPGFTPYEKPEKEPDSVRALTDLIKQAGIDPESPQGRAMYAAAAQKASTHQPATTVNVDTAVKPFVTEIGGAVGKDFATARQAAMGAVKSNQVADEAEKLLNSGVITGAGASLKLQGGKIMQAAGFRMDADQISNTEALISNLAQQTLANIRQSGLGGGSGFSNADRDFLQKATGGSIDMNEASLRKLVELNRRSNKNILTNFDSMARELEKRPDLKGIPLRLGIPSQTLRFDAQGNQLP
jgi:hypothetical protein